MLHQQKKHKQYPQASPVPDHDDETDDGVPSVSSYDVKRNKFLLCFEIFGAILGWILLPLFNDFIHNAVIGGGDKPFDVLFLIQDKKLFNEAVYYTYTVVVFVIQFICVAYSCYEVWHNKNNLMKSVFFWSAATGFFINIFTILPSPSTVQQEGYVVPFYFSVGSGSLSASLRYGWTMYILHFLFNRAHHKGMKALLLWFSILITTYALLTHQLYCLTIITSLLMVFGFNYWCQTLHYKALSDGVNAYVKQLYVEQKPPSKSYLKTHSIDDTDVVLSENESDEDSPAVLKTKSRFQQVSVHDDDDEIKDSRIIKSSNQIMSEQLQQITEKPINQSHDEPIELKIAEEEDEQHPMFNETTSITSTI